MAAAPYPGDVTWGPSHTLEKTIDSMIKYTECNYGDDYLQGVLWSGGKVVDGEAAYDNCGDSAKMDYFNEADENEPEVGDNDVTGGYRNSHILPPSYPETQDFYTQPTLNVPGQNLDLNFENVIVQNENEANVTAENRRKEKIQTSKQKRSLFRRKRKKKSNQSILGATSSGESEEFAYDNHIALEGVENTHPAIVVSQVRDGNDVIDEEEGFPAYMSIDIFEEEEDDDAFTPTGAVNKSKKNKRKKSRKFSIASALTDISFRSDRSNSTKVSSPSLLDVDWEADEDLRDSLSEFIRNRNGGSDAGKKRHRRKRGSQSTRSSDSEMDERETSDLLDMYSGKQNDEDQIFENLKIQNELIGSVRTQPWPMKKKLKTLQLAKSYVERYEGQLSRGHGYQEASAKYWKRVKREFMNFLSLLIPWEMRIKLIESYFGSVVASYFTFLRWLFWVNIVMTVLSMCFIVVPEILFGTPWGSTPEKSIPEDELAKALNFDTLMDWRGYLEHSLMFYGYYANTTIIGGVYRLPLAYLLVGLSAYGTSFLIILRKMTANSRLNKLTSKDEQYTFMWKTFTSWDFMIGNAETAKNKVAEISTVLRETIEEEKERTKKKTTKTLFFLRVLANILVLIVLASSTYAINLVVGRSQEVEIRLQAGEEVGWWYQNEVSFVMSLITALFPTLFDVIGLMEKYHPRMNLRLQLGRILVLYLMNLYTLMFALYWKIVDKAEAATVSNSNCTISGTTVSPPTAVTQMDGMFNMTNCTGANGGEKVCWETMLGQEISKLVFFDLIVTVATIVFIDFVRGLGVRYLNRYWCWDLEQKFPEYGEFKIAENLLHAIYNQATVWLGVFFAPLLPAVNMLKLLVMLYTRSWAVIVCNIPHERVFKASGSNNFYFGTLLLMLFLVTLPVAFLLVSLTPSGDCGPFKGYAKSYHVLTKTIETEFPEWVNKVLDYIASPGTIMPLILLLLMAIYYLSSLNASLKESNDDLRNQLHVERTEEREKAYKMGGARAEGTDGPEASRVPPPMDNKPKPPADKELPQVKVQRDKGKDSGEEQPTGEDEAPPPGNRGTRVMRIPGMSLDQANLLKTKYPGLRVMNRDEAVRLNIIPAPPPPPPEPESDDPEAEVKVDIEPVVDTDTPIDTSRESEHHPEDMQVKQGEILKESAVPTSDPMTSHISQSRPVRARSGPGSSPPIAIVQGKPSVQTNRFRFGDTAQDPTLDDAVLF